jgi:hypothetical protein
MKVTCNPFTYSGTCNGLVYYYSKRLDQLIARRYVVPKASSQNRKIGAISRNLKHLELSEGYINDLKVYLALYNYQPREKCFITWRNVFITLMFALERLVPEVDLLTITREQILGENLPCICVKDAVEAGLLEHVNGYERLSSQI